MVRKKARTSQHGLLRRTVLVACAIVLAWGICIIASRQIAVHGQQQRFAKIGPALQYFDDTMQEQLGVTAAGLKRTAYCTHQEQADFTNGTVWCATTVEGVVNELPSNGIQPGWNTAKRVDAVARAAFRRANLSISSSEPPARSESADSVVAYDDILYLFGQKMRCDVIANKLYTGSAPNGSLNLSVGKNQLYFALSCEQRSSKDFFKLSD